MARTFSLNNNPDWQAAAEALVNGCAALPSIEARVQLLEKLCIDLGDNLYPAFLQILCIVATVGDKQSQQLVTETLVHALTTGRLPSGKLSAWGADTLATTSAFSQNRSLGPIEYLCAWYSQPSGRNPLSASGFQQAMSTLLVLIASNDDAKALYCSKLQLDIEEPIGGALSNQTRSAMAALLNAWRQSEPPAAVIDAYFNALQGDRLERLNSINTIFR